MRRDRLSLIRSKKVASALEKTNYYDYIIMQTSNLSFNNNNKCVCIVSFKLQNALSKLLSTIFR